MKTINDIVQEYRNIQKAPIYLQIKVRDSSCYYESYTDISNLKTTKDDEGQWLEFDTENRHKRILGGTVVEYTNLISEKTKCEDHRSNISHH